MTSHHQHQQQQPFLVAARGNGVVAHAAASVAELQPSGNDSFLQPTPHQQHQQQQQQTQHHAAGLKQLLHAIRSARSHLKLLELLQDCNREQVTADLIKAVLFQASRIARSAAAAATTGSKNNWSSTSTSSKTTTASDGLAAQQLVCACLQLLLEANQQVCGWHLSNCLLSLGVLCGRGGPAAPVMAGSGPAPSLLPPSAGAVSDTAVGSHHHHQQQQATAGVLQQLISPARSSRRDLEALLQATGPEHQLQQLLHLTRDTAVASAQPGQLVVMLYGLAVLPLRPAPDVLGMMLQGLQVKGTVAGNDDAGWGVCPCELPAACCTS